MLEIVNNQYKLKNQKGGRRDGVTPQERLEITLKYLRQYVFQRYLAKEYGIAKSCISSIIKWITKKLLIIQTFLYLIEQEISRIFRNMKKKNSIIQMFPN